MSTPLNSSFVNSSVGWILVYRLLSSVSGGFREIEVWDTNEMI